MPLRNHRHSLKLLLASGSGGFILTLGFYAVPPPELLYAESRRSWASTSPSDPNRISLAVVRTLSGIQKIAAASCVSSDAADAASRSRSRLSRSTEFTAGSFFVTRMLEHASSDASSAAFREETSSYITSVMKDPRAASSFLSTSGNATRLFQALDRDRVLSERVWASMKDIDDIYVRLVSAGDFDVVVRTLGSYRQNEYKRRISLRMFRWWCQHSDFQFADKDVIKAIECMSTAASAVTTHDASSKFDIVRSMRHIIEHTGDVSTTKSAKNSSTLPWMWPLLCFAADGAGSRDWDLVNESLDAFTACVERGVLPQSSVHMIESSALPLLFTMSRDVPVSRLDVGVRIAECIGALARMRMIVRPSQKKKWAELFVGWLVRLDPRWREEERGGGGRLAAAKLIEKRALSESLVDALASLSAVEYEDEDEERTKEDWEREGGQQQIAHLWLADMIVHLSRMATAYSDVAGGDAAVEGGGHGKGEGAGKGMGGGGGGGGGGPAWTSSAWWWSWVPPYVYGGGANGSERASGSGSGNGGGDGGDGSIGAPLMDASSIAPSIGLSTGASKSLPKQQPSDPELAMYINASPIGPVYARAVAQRLLEISGNAVAQIENTDLEDMSPLTAASYSAAAAAVNQQVADDVMAQALKVTSALASGSSDNRRWLLMAGLPQLLRLFIERMERRKESQLGSGTETGLGLGDHVGMSTKLSRQVARLLALLSIEIEGANLLVRNEFIPWLQVMASSDDCKISSSAAKALLHVEAARESGLLLGPLREIGGSKNETSDQSNNNKNGRNNNNLLDPARVRATMQREMLQPEYDTSIVMQPFTSPVNNHHVGYEMMTLDLKKKRDMFAKQKRADAMWRNLRETRLVLHDGIHLMCPLAEHHEALAQRGTHAVPEEGAPEMDIVFIHGIRGGAFITWRQEQAFARGGARGNVDHSVCWPAAWLAPKFPTARLITAEYAAPATWWEGESLPLHGMVNNMAERLAAAGVGSRPVVFVCHSMGGLVIKEIISRGTEKDAPLSMRSISNAAVGAVFYSVPHAGSRLADVGWKLRYLGASPSRAVANLKTDPHLHDETNDIIRGLCKRDKLRVLSFSEGMPTKLSYRVYTHVVPHESAYPGYGEFQVLDEKDHINICKPKSTDDPSFAKLVEWLACLRRDLMMTDDNAGRGS